MRALLMVIAFVTVAALPGCATDLGIKGGQGVEIDPFNWGTGQPVFAPANDHWFANGEPMDYRRSH